MLKQGKKDALALASIIFLNIWSKLFHLRFLYFNFAKIEGFKFFRKYLYIVSLFRALIRLYSDKMDCKYLK